MAGEGDVHRSILSRLTGGLRRGRFIDGYVGRALGGNLPGGSVGGGHFNGPLREVFVAFEVSRGQHKAQRDRLSIHQSFPHLLADADKWSCIEHGYPKIFGLPQRIKVGPSSLPKRQGRITSSEKVLVHELHHGRCGIITNIRRPFSRKKGGGRSWPRLVANRADYRVGVRTLGIASRAKAKFFTAGNTRGESTPLLDRAPHRVSTRMETPSPTAGSRTELAWISTV